MLLLLASKDQDGVIMSLQKSKKLSEVDRSNC